MVGTCGADAASPRAARMSAMSHRPGVDRGSVALLAAALFLMVSGVAAQLPQARVSQNQAVVAQFDVDKDGRLNAAERQAAREALASRGGRGGRGRGGFGRAPASPGI